MKIFRGPKTLSIILTLNCPAECYNCGTFSNPRIKRHLELNLLLATIENAKKNGFSNIVFTGGEPTIMWTQLLIGLKKAKELEFPTRIVTNAHWALSEIVAVEKIQKLLEAGLDEINFSTGDEHIRFIPLERVINAIVAAISLNLRTYLMIECKSENRITKDNILNHPRIKALSEKDRKLFDFSESPWMPVDYKQIANYPNGITVNKENIALRTGCDSILQTYVLEPDGKISACCGLGIRLIPELFVGQTKGHDFLENAIIAAENDFLKLLIHYKGPERIIEWAAEKNPEIVWENLYAHRCQACCRMYKDDNIKKIIKEHYSEMIAEIVHCAFLEEEYLPQKMNNSIKSYRRINNANLLTKHY